MNLEPAPAPPASEASDRSHAEPIVDLAVRLATDVDGGLTSSEAARRLSTDGPNAIHREQGPSAGKILAAQFGASSSWC